MIISCDLLNVQGICFAFVVFSTHFLCIKPGSKSVFLLTFIKNLFNIY